MLEHIRSSIAKKKVLLYAAVGGTLHFELSCVSKDLTFLS